jgi:lysophospholipase L1-like esterase
MKLRIALIAPALFGLVLLKREETSSAPPGTLVAFGDSLTFGAGVRPDQSYPTVLSTLTSIHVVNAGLSGNTVILECPACGTPGVRRFATDVLTVPAVHIVVVLLGINDVRRGATVTRITEGLASIITQAHRVHLRIIGVTLLPIKPRGPYIRQAHSQEIRAAVNAWIRHAPYDAVVDGDVLADAQGELDPRYDSGDGLHLSVLGYRMLAQAVARSLH